MTPKRGDILTPKFSCSLWTADGTAEVDSLQPGDVLLVLSSLPPELGMWYQPRKVRINHHRYRQVVSPRETVGWVHIDNCSRLDKSACS